MKQLLFVVIACCAMCTVSAQSDTNGIPDIFLPEQLVTIEQVILPGVVIEFTANPLDYRIVSDPVTGVQMLVPAGTGDGNPAGGGQITPPPPCGYKFNCDDAGKSGTEYVTVNGKLADGTPFSLTAQVYISGNTKAGEKAVEIEGAFNNASDNHPADPIVASAAKGSVVVQPAAGCKVTSSEWNNGSGEEDNSTDTLNGPEQQQTKNSTCSLAASTIRGTPAGISCKHPGTSYAAVGCGPFMVKTFVDRSDTALQILNRLSDGLDWVKINNHIGIDTKGEYWLVWEDVFLKARFGTDDLGINDVLLTEMYAPLLKGKTSYNVGNYIISTQ